MFMNILYLDEVKSEIHSTSSRINTRTYTSRLELCVGVCVCMYAYIRIVMNNVSSKLRGNELNADISF